MIRFSRFLLVSLTLVLAACDGSGFRAAPSTSGSNLSATPMLVPKVYVYVTSGNNVEIYYNGQHQLKQVGEITGLREPRELCSDTSGDVFVTEGLGQSIQEYARGGTTLIARIDDPNAQPDGCSFDPKTGNLAVTNQCTGTGTACTENGNVAVYTGATGKPAYYTTSVAYYPSFCTYDNLGNLYVVGGDNGENKSMVELAYGSTEFKEVVLNEGLITPTAVQFDGSFVTVTDAKLKELYRFAVSDYKGISEGYFPLHSVGKMQQTWIQDGLFFIAKDIAHGSGGVVVLKYDSFDKWRRTAEGLDSPFGITVTN